MEKEFVLPSDLVISSSSDLAGNITQYNAGFRDASGYSDEELKGKPHSLLRHPDMPKEAFADLWRTLESGCAWFGIVKNKRKNGDYYWVVANASPIYRDGKVTGYVSVRYPASRDQVASAQKLYADVRAGKAKVPATRVNKSTKLISGLTLVSSLAPFALMYQAITSGQLGWAVFSVSSLITLWLGMRYVYGLLSPNEAQQVAILALSNGQYRDKFAGNDPWIFALNMIRSRFADAAAHEFDHAKNVAVLTTAMDVASTNLMVASTDFTILSINASLVAMFARNEAEIQKSLPQFTASRVVGSNIDIFHQDPVRIRQMLVRLTEAWTTELVISGLAMRLTVAPIVRNGIRAGYVVEWLDRTQESSLETQLEVVANAAKTGLLHHRIDLTNSYGVYLSLGKDINQLLDVLANFSSVISFSVGEMAFSRLSSDMTGDFNGIYRCVQNAVNVAVRNLNELLGQVQYVSRQVNTEVRQLSDGVNHFSDQTQQQAIAIEQTASLMVEMLSVLNSNASNVKDAHSLAKEVHNRVEEGNMVMQQALEAMKQIHNSGSKIADIVVLIDSIAFQTNLLALNAAVEAARAGEHGRGFAVVASEVRSLAQKSADAAKNIKSLIDDSVHQIDLGTQLVQKTSVALTDVRHSVDDMSRRVSHIAESAREQEKGIDAVNKSIVIIDKVAQQSAALIEETAVSAGHVASEMQTLDAIVRQFTLSSAGQEISRTGRTLLADMKQAHLNWRLRMSNVILGRETITDTTTVKNHHLCGLGKWRDSTGRGFEHLSEMKALDVLHPQFHALVTEAIEAANRGERDKAIDMLMEIDALSGKIVALLDALEIAMMRAGAVAVDNKHQHIGHTH